MSRLKQLLNDWQDQETEQHGVTAMQLELPVNVVARVMALAEMYPGRSQQQIIGDLLQAALFDMEESMPYVAGDTVIARDEFGDAIYEDTGPGPRFQQLTRHYLQQLKS